MTLHLPSKDASLPTVDLSLDSIVCPECGHDPADQHEWPKPIDMVAGIRSLIGMKPRRAQCMAPELDTSGLPPLPCECAHSIHNS
jgi:hypothetical protein